MESTRQKVYNLIAQGKNKKDIANILNISVRSIERYTKEYNDITTKESDKKATTTSDRKKRKEIAKSLIVSGESIEEATAQSGTTIDTCKKLSSKEKLQQAQLEFLKSFREEKLKEIRANKLKRLSLNSRYLGELETLEMSKQTQEILLLNEKTEQEILELNRLERLDRVEAIKKENRLKQVEAIAMELNNLSDEDLKKIMDLIAGHKG